MDRLRQRSVWPQRSSSKVCHSLLYVLHLLIADRHHLGTKQRTTKYPLNYSLFRENVAFYANAPVQRSRTLSRQTCFDYAQQVCLCGFGSSENDIINRKKTGEKMPYDRSKWKKCGNAAHHNGVIEKIVLIKSRAFETVH